MNKHPFKQGSTYVIPGNVEDSIYIGPMYKDQCIIVIYNVVTKKRRAKKVTPVIVEKTENLEIWALDKNHPFDKVKEVTQC